MLFNMVKTIKSGSAVEDDLAEAPALKKIGKTHPQSLIYPLTVCSKSETKERRIEVPS